MVRKLFRKLLARSSPRRSAGRRTSKESRRELTKPISGINEPGENLKVSAAEHLEILLSQINGSTGSESTQSAEMAIETYLADSMAPIQPLDNPNIRPEEVLQQVLCLEGCSGIAALRRTRIACAALCRLTAAGAGATPSNLQELKDLVSIAVAAIIRIYNSDKPDAPKVNNVWLVDNLLLPLLQAAARYGFRQAITFFDLVNTAFEELENMDDHLHFAISKAFLQHMLDLPAGAVIKCGSYFATLNYMLPFLVADMTCKEMCRIITFAISACEQEKGGWYLHWQALTVLQQLAEVAQAAIKKQLQPGLHKESSNIVRAVISSIWEILPVLNTLAANDALLVSTTAINTMGVLDSLTHQKMDSTESKLMRASCEEPQSPTSLSGSDNVTEKENAACTEPGDKEKPSNASGPVSQSAPAVIILSGAPDQESAVPKTMPSTEHGILQEQAQPPASLQTAATAALFDEEHASAVVEQHPVEVPAVAEVYPEDVPAAAERLLEDAAVLEGKEVKGLEPAFKLTHAFTNSLKSAPKIDKAMIKLAKIGSLSLQDIMAGASITINLQSNLHGLEGTFIQCRLKEVQRQKASLVSNVDGHTSMEAFPQEESAVNTLTRTKGQDSIKVADNKLAEDCKCPHTDAGAAQFEMEEGKGEVEAEASPQEDQQRSSALFKQDKDVFQRTPLGCAMGSSNTQAQKASEERVEHAVGVSPLLSMQVKQQVKEIEEPSKPDTASDFRGEAETIIHKTSERETGSGTGREEERAEVSTIQQPTCIQQLSPERLQRFVTCITSRRGSRKEQPEKAEAMEACARIGAAPPVKEASVTPTTEHASSLQELSPERLQRFTDCVMKGKDRQGLGSNTACHQNKGADAGQVVGGEQQVQSSLPEASSKSPSPVKDSLDSVQTSIEQESGGIKALKEVKKEVKIVELPTQKHRFRKQVFSRVLKALCMAP